MKLGVKRRGLALLLMGAFGTGALAPASRADTQPDPSWADEIIGHVWYDNVGDQRKNDTKKGINDFINYRINEDGVITGRDFLNQSAQDQLAAMFYETMLDKAPEHLCADKSVSQLRQEYRQQLEDKRMAILILNRIIDHEAMKHKLEPDVPDARVDYIMRSILIQYAADAKYLKAHVVMDPNTPKDKPPQPQRLYDWVLDDPKNPGDPQPTTCHLVVSLRKPKHDKNGKQLLGELKTTTLLDEDPSLISNEQLFSWMKKDVGDKDLSFETDWTYADIGTYFDHDHLHDKPDLGWPTEARLGYRNVIDPDTHAPVTIRGMVVSPTHVQPDGTGSGCQPIVQEQRVIVVFSPFPKTWQEFREQIRTQLQATYRQYMRMLVWKELAAEKDPLMDWQANFSVTTDQLNQMYAALKNSPSIQLTKTRAIINEVRVTGAKAGDFKKDYLALLDQAEAQHEKEFESADPCANSTPEQKKAWIARVALLRRQIQAEAYGKTVVKYATDIAAGKLHASSDERTLVRAATDQPAQGPGFEADEQNQAFDMGFFTQRLVARLDGVASDSSIKIMTVLDHQDASEYRDLRDPQVEQLLRTQIENRTRGKVFRQLAFSLFQARNGDKRFTFDHNFCEEAGWPCSYADDPRVAPRLLADALFPELLYPGQELPTLLQQYGPDGRLLPAPKDAPRISSTLNHDEYFDRVQEISIDNLQRVFSAPNDHVDNDIRLHNY